MIISTTDIIKKLPIWQTLILPSNRKLSSGFRLTYLDLTVANSKGQEHVHFDGDYIGKNDS